MFHSFIDLTKHFTARIDNSHATPVNNSLFFNKKIYNFQKMVRLVV